MADYSISDEAAQDLEQIYSDGIDRFGRDQAVLYQDQLHATFQRTAEFPGIGGQPLAKSGRLNSLYRHVHQTHIVVYALGDDSHPLRIVRVLPGRMNYLKSL